MPTSLTLPEIQSQLLDVVAEQQRIPREKLHPAQRLVQDLNIDSLDLVELFMAVEDAFDVSLPNEVRDNPAYKAVFTRDEFHLSDLAELVYLQRDSTKRPGGMNWRKRSQCTPPSALLPFTQLGGTRDPNDHKSRPLFESLGKNAQGCLLFRRRTDGMMCVKIPTADNVTLGSPAESPFPDEHPLHRVTIHSFLIDIEPVSTTAYCRFLNSIGPRDEATYQKWFLLSRSDRRRIHELIQPTDGGWQPVPGTERFPMVLVSWHGAQAYSAWANGARDLEDFSSAWLPTEAQWEYAARGADGRMFPWGNSEPDNSLARFAQFERGKTYAPAELPLAEVNAPLGVSPFGVRHMAGNIWQWCADFYAPDFYRQADSLKTDPFNGNATHIRSERGGSWIGPAFLCRSTYRRGRIPMARGRCLGFRCVSRLST
jgi:acyl carrier protein